MTLQDAIKSGKRFKRTLYEYYIHRTDTIGFTVTEVLADDWEIEEVKLTFTQHELAEAISICRQSPLLHNSIHLAECIFKLASGKY